MNLDKLEKIALSGMVVVGVAMLILMFIVTGE
jgi:hypothetical protein